MKADKFSYKDEKIFRLYSLLNHNQKKSVDKSDDALNKTPSNKKRKLSGSVDKANFKQKFHDFPHYQEFHP
jgi:hypothetical protein